MVDMVINVASGQIAGGNVQPRFRIKYSKPHTFAFLASGLHRLSQGDICMNVLEVLKKDHTTVQSLFEAFGTTCNSSQEKKTELFEQIRRELQLHTKAEEEVFYPALKALNDSGQNLVLQALKEHKEVDELLTQISRLNATDADFDEKVESLIEDVRHHIEEEEGQIFQFAAENCSDGELEDLGREIEERKKVLGRRWAA